jgi:two-component system chemotaxis response regulator CheY
MRKIVRKSLQAMGFTEFILAEDGQIAWSYLEQDKEIGLIVCDWNMPNMSGIELLAKVRETPDKKNIPFVLVTAESEASQVKQAFALGVDGYVVKPFSAASLKPKIETAYKRYQMRSAA